MLSETAGAAARIAAIYRYPVKGLSAEPLDSVALQPGETLPYDRAFAIEAGGAAFDPAAPRHLAKTHFLMLMRDERLATLETRFDPADGTLAIRRDGKQVARGDLSQPVGRRMIEQFFAAFMGKELRGAPRIVQAPGHSFSDISEKVVSILNLASVRDLARVIGRPVDPLRFRANIHVEGLDPWAEFDWLGRTLGLGGAGLTIQYRIGRCAATNVDPDTGARDMQIPRTLTQAFGHHHCGVYARVDVAGRVAVGDELRLEAAAR